MPLLSDLHALAGDIGPRGTGTPGEQAAAEYVAGRLAALGLPIERHTFRAVGSQNAFPLTIDLVALFAVVLYPWGGALGRWLAAGLALATAPLLWSTIRTSGGPLRPLLARVTSRNVVTRLEPLGQSRQQVVLLAHLDTNRCRLAWQSSTVRYLEPLTYLTLAILALLGGLYLGGALLGGPAWVWWVSLLPAAYVAGTIVTLWRDDRTPYTPGAHDNAASVAVALELAARLAVQRPSHTRVWLAFTGAEETDHAGLYTLLRQHGSVLRQAAFIGLEGPGSGEIVYLRRQGLCARYGPDPGLLAVAERVAARRPDLGVRAAQMVLEDEVGTLRRAGHRAICIAGRDPATGTLPHWHRADDTVDTIDGQALERAADFVLAMLHELDATASTGGEGTCVPL
jgi:hypothetical protein